MAQVVKNPPAKAGDIADVGFPGLGRSPGEGSGDLLQDSRLGNPMGRRAWRATFHRVAKNRTWLMYTLSACLVSQLCLTLCDPLDCSPPGFSVHGIPQTRTLEGVAMPSSRGSPHPRDGPRVSCVSCFAGRFFSTSTTWEAQTLLIVALHSCVSFSCTTTWSKTEKSKYCVLAHIYGI